jgi:hypothetical protein
MWSENLSELSEPVDLLFEALHAPQADTDAAEFTSILRGLYCRVVGDDRHVFVEEGRPPAWTDVEEWFRQRERVEAS